MGIRHACGGSAATEIGFDYTRVALYFCWRAFGDFLTVIEHGDAFGNTHHNAHVMFNEQD